MKFKKISKVIALFLAIVTLSVAVPITSNAAVKSDVPYPMRNNFVLDALQYLGYDVQKLKNDGFLYQDGYYGGDLIDEGNSSRRNYGLNILSNITYDDYGSISGLNTKNEKPDIGYFESNGLNCASFVTYVYLNYLPNVAKKADGSSYKDDATYKYIKKAMEHWTQVNGWSYQADDTWREAFNEYANNKEIRKYTASYSDISQMESSTNNNGISQIQALNLEEKLDPGDLICLGRLNKSGSVKDWVHVAIYLGTYNGEDYVAHCTGGDEGQLRNNGSGRGPEISTLSEIFARKTDDKFSYPIEFYALDWPYDFGTIEINKTGENGQKLAGAEFYITDGKNNNAIIVTNDKGYVKSPELPLGTYTVTETVFPEGFGTGTMQVVKGGNATSNTNSITVTLSSDSTEIVINAVNKVNTGMIYGYKSTKDSSGALVGLSGAKMGLFPAGTTNFTESNAIATCISGQTIPGTTTFHPGGYYFTNVKYGTYLIKEIEAPNGYVLSNETRSVTLNSDKTMVSVSIVNYEKPCSIKGYKVDETGNALRGVTFGLFASTETEFTRETAIGICRTDANGVFSFDNLRTGKYIVMEIVPLAGYGLNDKKYEVNLTVGGTEYVIAEKIVNEKFYGKIYGYKLNAINDMPLAGAKIGLFNSDSNFNESNAIKVVTTGSDGYFEFSNLEGGKTYWVKELEAPRGFLLSDAVFKRNIDSDEPIEYILYNDDFYVSIQGHKIDENEVGIGGAEIGIFIKESEDLSYYVKKNALYVATTSDDGYFKFDSLARGTYIIKELTPPPGYKLNNIRYEIIVANKDDVTVNTIEADGSVVDSRRYTTPAKIASIDIKIENKPVIVTGTKVDLNKEPLSGAIIGLFNSTETEFTEITALQSFETLSDGTFTFTHVPAGRYYIKEISAPAGFEVSEIKYTLIVTAVGSYQIRDENNVRLTNVEIINLPSPHKIDVTKLDSEGNTLSGAIFLLEWSEDGITYSPISYTATYSAQKGFTTTNVIDGKITVPESGNITFEGLCPNLYYRVTETKAPDGYNLLKEAAFEGFVSTNDNILVKLDVINTPIFVLPPTGGYANYIVPVSVILSVGIASVAIYLIKKNRKEKQK